MVIGKRRRTRNGGMLLRGGPGTVDPGLMNRLDRGVAEAGQLAGSSLRRKKRR